MEGVEILKSLFDKKKISLLQTIIRHENEELTLQEISKKSKIPLATAHRTLKLLSDLNLIERQKVKHLTLYKLANNKEANYIKQLLYEDPEPIKRLTELLKAVPNISKAIIHGPIKKTNCNLVIIGSDIDKAQVNSIILQIKEELNFKVSHLILEQEQFEMLEAMGQFSGQQNIIIDNT